LDAAFLNSLEQTNARLQSRQDMAVLLLDQPSYLIDLIKFVNNPQHKFALKSIWTIEQAMLINPLCIVNHLELFISTLPEKQDDSTLRSIAKIGSIILTNPILKKAFDQLDKKVQLHMVDCNFIWFTKAYRVAVKVHAMENLSRLCNLEDWIKPNLIELIELNYQSQSAAYQARARKVLNRLKKLN